MKGELNVKLDDSKKMIFEKSDLMIKSIENQRDELLQKVISIERSDNQSINDEIESLKSKKTIIEESISMIEKTIEEKDSILLLQSTNNIIEKAKIIPSIESTTKERMITSDINISFIGIEVI